MSWSATTTQPIAKSEIVHIAGNSQTGNGENESKEHMSAAYDAAVALAAVVGRSDDLVSVSMNGHANDGHAPVSGWSDEQITITVRAMPPK